VLLVDNVESTLFWRCINEDWHFSYSSRRILSCDNGRYVEFLVADQDHPWAMQNDSLPSNYMREASLCMVWNSKPYQYELPYRRARLVPVELHATALMHGGRGCIDV
jgi:hypothetical protein